jgi:hypothetical protein
MDILMITKENIPLSNIKKVSLKEKWSIISGRVFKCHEWGCFQDNKMKVQWKNSDVLM